MEGTMNPQPIAPLMDAVLRTLGRHSRQDYLRLALRQAGLSDAQLLKVDHAPPYPVAWAEMGLGLVLQRLAWGDMPGAPTWGVHSVTLDAQRWKGSWPMGLNPETVTAQEFVSLLAQDQAEALCLPQMACCTTRGFDEQTWALVAVFGGASGALQNLTVSRVGEWVGISMLPAWQGAG
jgi:hypothetical protein